MKTLERSVKKWQLTGPDPADSLCKKDGFIFDIFYGRDS